MTHVSGAGIFLSDSSSGTGTTNGLEIRTSSSDAYIVNQESGELFMGNANSSNILTLDSTNRVGINDTAPSYELDVNGDINCTG